MNLGWGLKGCIVGDLSEGFLFWRVLDGLLNGRWRDFGGRFIGGVNLDGGLVRRRQKSFVKGFEMRLGVLLLG
jgi:hypothetical protein